MLPWLQVMEPRHPERRKDPSGELFTQTNKLTGRGILMSCSEEWNVVLYPVPVHQSECGTVSSTSPSVRMWYCIQCQSVSQNVVLYLVPVHQSECGTVSSASL